MEPVVEDEDSGEDVVSEVVSEADTVEGDTRHTRSNPVDRNARWIQQMRECNDKMGYGQRRKGGYV